MDTHLNISGQGSGNREAVVLVRLIHYGCGNRTCETNDAINFGDYTSGILTLSNDIITTLTKAAEEYMEITHGCRPNISLISAGFCWACGKDPAEQGSDLLNMSEAMRCSQLKFALYRRQTDWLEVEFTSRTKRRRSNASSCQVKQPGST
ncbi:hypothetical protein ANO14919_069960 [Xylariales sp. No.14919]|nr:hypothetical protein ANO14919_069960 [Xylariales sp. No.14919]